MKGAVSVCNNVGQQVAFSVDTEPVTVPPQMPLKFPLKETDLLHSSCLTQKKEKIQRSGAPCPSSATQLRGRVGTKTQVFWLLPIPPLGKVETAVTEAIGIIY